MHEDKLLSTVYLAKVCLTYLSFDNIGPIEIRTERAVEHSNRKDQHHFYHYVREFWAEHTRAQAEDDQEASALLDNLLRSPQLLTSTRKVYKRPTHPLFPPWRNCKESVERTEADFVLSPLLVIVTNDLVETCERLLKAHSHDSSRPSVIEPRTDNVIPDLNLGDLRPDSYNMRFSLVRASGMGHASIVTALLKNGADPNSAIDSHENALIAATAGGHVGVMKILLEHGADPNINFVDDCLPAVLVASELGHLDLLELLLESGADVNVRDAYGASALHIAARRGNNNVAEMLLEYGLDVNVVNKTGHSPLHEAAHCNKEYMVYTLSEHGAEINLRSNNGVTPLLTAAAGGTLDTVKALVECGADIHARDLEGWTALHMAAKDCSYERVRYFLESGLDIHGRTKDGATPLIAMEFGWDNSHYVLHLLLKGGADLDARDNRGWTAYTHASVSGNDYVAHLLLEMGADVGKSQDDV